MNVPYKYWAEVVVCACHIMNRIPSEIFTNKSPLEIIRQKQIKIDHFRMFGCYCYVHLHEKQRNKLEARVVKCIFLGYLYRKKNICYEPIIKKKLLEM